MKKCARVHSIFAESIRHEKKKCIFRKTRNRLVSSSRDTTKGPRFKGL